MASSDDISRKRNLLWWATAIFFLASIVSILDRQILNLMVDPVRRDLHISDVQISLLQGASFSIFYAVVGLPLGFCADRLSRRWLLIFGVAAWSLATIAAGLATSFTGLFVARICVGFGEATLSPCVVSMIRDMAPPARRGRPISIFLLGQSLGNGISILLVGAILAAAPKGAFAALPLLSGLAPWRIAFVLAGAVGFIVVALLFTLREPPRDNDRAEKTLAAIRSSAGYFKDNAGLLTPIYLGFACLSIGNYAQGAWGPTMLVRRFGMTAAQVGGLLGVVTLCAAVAGALAGGLIADRAARSKDRSAKLTALMLVSLSYLPGGFAVFAPSPIVAVLMMGVSVACFPIMGVLMLSLLQEVTPPRVAGMATALLNFSSALIGLTAGPVLVAWLTQSVLGDPRLVGQALTLTILPAVAGAALLFLWARRRFPRSPVR